MQIADKDYFQIHILFSFDTIICWPDEKLIHITIAVEKKMYEQHRAGGLEHVNSGPKQSERHGADKTEKYEHVYQKNKKYQMFNVSVDTLGCSQYQH
jgi:hypothetical protein